MKQFNISHDKFFFHSSCYTLFLLIFVSTYFRDWKKFAKKGAVKIKRTKFNTPLTFDCNLVTYKG